MSILLTDPASLALSALCQTYLGQPIAYWDDTQTPPTPVFIPALSSGNQATLADLATMAHFGISADITLAEFQAIKPQLVELRTFRQRTLAQWNALTAAQRTADMISYSNDLTDVLRALLRS